MKRLTLVLLAGVVLLTAGCGGVQVKKDFDPEYNFDTMRTFDYLPKAENCEIADLRFQAIQAKTTLTLGEKGYIQSETPDVLIGLHGMEYNDSTSVTSAYNAYGWDMEKETWAVRKGHVLFDFIDTKSNEIIWVGTADTGVSPNLTEGQIEMKIDEMVKRLFYDFPPQKRK
jgi:hypothetical protein